MKAVRQRKVRPPVAVTGVAETSPVIGASLPPADARETAGTETNVITRQKQELPKWMRFKRKPKPVTYRTLVIRKPEYGGLEQVVLEKEVGPPRECIWDHKIRYLAISGKPKGDISDLRAFEASDYAIKGNIGSDKDIADRESDGFYPGELWEPIIGWRRAHVAFAPDKTWLEKFSPLLGIGALGIGFLFLIVLIDFINKL